MTKKTIAIISNGEFPIPAVKGGSVATHIEYLINYNESYPTMKFIVISVLDLEAKKRSQKYKHSKFLFIDKKRIKFRLMNGIRHEIDKFCRFFSKISFERGFISESVMQLKKLPDKIDAILIKDKLSSAEYVKNKFPNVKLFSCAEWDYLNENLYRQTPKQVESIFNHTDCFICVSNFIKNQIDKIPIRRKFNFDVVTCYNGLKPERFRNKITVEEKKLLRENLGFTKDEFVILFTGRLIQIKGILELIKAYLPIKDRAKLLILGNVDFNKLNKTKYTLKLFEITENNLNNIKFTGYVEYSKIHNYYKIANAVVLPSLCEEAFNLSLVESMFSRVAVIITKSGGMPEIATNGGAIIIERDDKLTENITKNLLNIIENPSNFSGMLDIAAKRAENFTNTKYAESMINILSSIPNP